MGSAELRARFTARTTLRQHYCTIARLYDCTTVPKSHPRPTQVGPRAAQEPLWPVQEPPQSPKKHEKRYTVGTKSAFRQNPLSEPPRAPQEPPKSRQERPRAAQGSAQEAQGKAQEPPRGPPGGPRSGPGALQERPRHHKSRQETPKRSPGGPQRLNIGRPAPRRTGQRTPRQHFRNHCSKGLSAHLHARAARGHVAQTVVVERRRSNG